jgi:DNA-binding response OmpR family regulator
MLHTQVPKTLFPSFASSPTVLLVEESDDTHHLLCEVISAAGYIVISAENSDEALKCMKTAAPDVILLDTTSPLFEGLALGRRIKSTPIWSKIPILFMIGQANTSQIISSLENGAVDYLSKPLRLPEVLARLLTCVTARVHDGQPNGTRG